MEDNQADQGPGPGWYPDPDGAQEQLRWWNGEGWTRHVTHDPSWEPVEPDRGPPGGPPRGAPSVWSDALLPTGTTLVVLASLVLVVAAALVLAAGAFQESSALLSDGGPTPIGRRLLSLCLAPGVTDGVVLLAGALLLRASRTLDLSTGVGRLRLVAIGLGTLVAATQILGALVALADSAAGGYLAFPGAWDNASIALLRLAALVPAIAALWLLGWEPARSLAGRASVAVPGEPAPELGGTGDGRQH